MHKQRIPLYHEIANQYAERILAGEWRPGQQIPSVRDIAEQHEITNRTAQAVMRELVGRGLVNAVRGSGSYVAPTATGPSEWWSRIENGGPVLRPGETAAILTAGLIDEPPAAVLAHLGLAEDSKAARREYVITDVDGKPVTYGESWFSPQMAALVPLLLSPEPLERGDIAAIAQATGKRTNATPYTVETRWPGTRAQLQALDLPDGAPVMVVLTDVYDEDGTLVEYAEAAHPPGYRIAVRG